MQAVSVHEEAARKNMKTVRAFTHERHGSPQEWASGWSICHPSDWHADNLPHRKNHHSLALRCSEGTERCIALLKKAPPFKLQCFIGLQPMAVNGTGLIGGRWSSPHSNRAPCTVWLQLDTPACSTVIHSTCSHQTGMASPSSGIGTKKWKWDGTQTSHLC